MVRENTGRVTWIQSKILYAAVLCNSFFPARDKFTWKTIACSTRPTVYVYCKDKA